MSFRNNLQHLRATRNMTQEQLAMLLGVSRQSVTKWEAEKSYPEMDKLLKLCQIFECSLDDLVQGDLTGRAADRSVAPAIPAGPPQDVCGYDEHQRMLARKVPAGIAAILVAVGIGFLFVNDGMLGLDGGAVFIGIVLVGVLVGLGFCIPAGMEHTAFMKAHPYIEDFYTEEDRAQARTNLARALVAGIGSIFVGVCCIVVLGELRSTESLGLFLLMLFVAAGVWPIVRYGMLYGRTNVAEYNKGAVQELEMEDIMQAKIDEDLRASLLEDKRHDEKIGAVCGVIMIVATIVGLLLLFVPPLMSPDPDTFDAMGTPSSFFWLAWPVGGLLCGIVSILMNAFGRGGRS